MIEYIIGTIVVLGIAYCVGHEKETRKNLEAATALKVRWGENCPICLSYNKPYAPAGRYNGKFDCLIIDCGKCHTKYSMEPKHKSVPLNGDKPSECPKCGRNDYLNHYKFDHEKKAHVYLCKIEYFITDISARVCSSGCGCLFEVPIIKKDK